MFLTSGFFRTIFTNYEGRKLEWYISMHTMGIGLWISLPTLSMPFRPGYFGPLSIMAEETWGLLFTIIGSVHFISLHINGRAYWTPFARAFALLLNATALLTFAHGLFLFDFWTTGVFVWTSYGILGCGMAFVSAMGDCGKAWLLYKRSKDDGTN